MTDACCKVCRYARESAPHPMMGLTERSYECRHNPPQAHMLAGPGGQPVTIGLFPPTRAENWCGEFRHIECE